MKNVKQPFSLEVSATYVENGTEKDSPFIIYSTLKARKHSKTLEIRINTMNTSYPLLDIDLKDFF